VSTLDSYSIEQNGRGDIGLILHWDICYDPANIKTLEPWDTLNIYEKIEYSGWTHSEPHPELILLGIQVFNPPHCFSLTNLSQIALGGWQIRMSQNHFTDYLYGNAWARCICGGVSPQIMGSQSDPYLLALFSNHCPCSLIANRENSLIGFSAFFPDMIFDESNSTALPSRFLMFSNMHVTPTGLKLHFIWRFRWFISGRMEVAVSADGRLLNRIWGYEVPAPWIRGCSIYPGSVAEFTKVLNFSWIKAFGFGYVANYKRGGCIYFPNLAGERVGSLMKFGAEDAGIFWGRWEWGFLRSRRGIPLRGKMFRGSEVQICQRQQLSKGILPYRPQNSSHNHCTG